MSNLSSLRSQFQLMKQSSKVWSNYRLYYKMCGMLHHLVKNKHRLHQYYEKNSQKKSVIVVLYVSLLPVMVALHLFSKKYRPMITSPDNPHQIVTHSGCIGFCRYTYGFCKPQLRQFCLLTKSKRRKWASFEKMLFFWRNQPNECQRCESVNQFITFSEGSEFIDRIE